MMSWLSRISLASVAALVLMTAPARAQATYDIVEDVTFVERVSIGGFDVEPFTIVRDRRCADIRFCTRENTLIITVVLYDYRGPRILALELGEPAPVPGGFLVLLDAGTPPSARSAIRLRNYAFDIEFIPLRFAEGS